MPIYDLLKCVAAVKAVWQLFTRPHYWEKTAHGLVAEPPEVAVAPPVVEPPREVRRPGLPVTEDLW